MTGADLCRFRPWIILIEATAPNSQEPTYQDWEDILLNANYHFAWFDGLNRFYVSSERLDLMSAFRVQPNVFDNFVTHTEVETHMQLEHTQADFAEATAREQQANAALQMAQTELVEQRSLGDELRDEVSRLAAERDAWMQELFETNRYAADLTQVRQTLLDDKQRLESENGRLLNENKRLEVDKARLLDENQRLNVDKIQIHNQIHAMYVSTSWKFSRPVRVVGKLLGRR